MAPIITGNRVPLYRQVAQTLKHRVKTGLYHSGNPLPSVRTLCEEFKVSSTVVQQAVYSLEEDGIVVTQHGKGMMVGEETPCRQAAILFGLIEPYETCMGFESQVLRYAEKVFEQRNDFVVIRSTEGSVERERQVAQHFIRNGVKGLILWPVEDDPNGPFFMDLARQIPIVVVDRKLKDSTLPSIQYDMNQAGREVCRCMLKKLGRKRLLVLMDNLKISPYQDFISGLREEAAELNKGDRLTILQKPVSVFCRQLNQGDFSQVDLYQSFLKQTLTQGKYDAFFCFQDEVIDYVLIEPGLIGDFREVQLGSTFCPATNTRSRRFNETPIVKLLFKPNQLIQQAANMLQEWVYTRSRPKDLPLLNLDLDVQGLSPERKE
jgi:DNA-binding LacI/PurR family transcriptional regulator